MTLCNKVLSALCGKTLATAESCTGGMIGASLTSVPGASNVYCGGVISYTNAVKHQLLDVPAELLNACGAVSAAVAEAMATGVRKYLQADVAVSVTGLAGPTGDAFGNPVGTVYIGYSDESVTLSRKYLFLGDRDTVRHQAAQAALALVLEFHSPGEATL